MIIKNGIIQEDSIAGVELVKMIARPKTGFAFPNRELSSLIGVTIHNTGNADPTADALAHARYVQTVENQGHGYQSSYHFCVDDKRIVQILPTNKIAWHAGDGANGTGNSKTLAIEICENGDHKKAEENALILAGALMAYYKGIEIYKHQDWNGKYCPHLILERGGWKRFREDAYKKRDELSGGNKEAVVPDLKKFYRVQVGSFEVKENAERLAKSLSDQGYTTWVVETNLESNNK